MIRLLIDNVFTQATASDPSELNTIEACLQYEVKNYQAIKANMRRRQPSNPYWRNWDGKKSFFDTKYGAFLTGLLASVIPYLRACDIDYEIVDRRSVPDRVASVTSKVLHKLVLRDYQVRAANEFLDKGRGVIKLSTGGGKTEVAIAVAKVLRLPTIFLTHRVNLLYQTAKRFVSRWPEMKSQIGVIGDGNYQPKFITLATVQTLQAMMKRASDEFVDLMAYFQFMIIDEAHRAASDQFNRPAILAKNCYYRMALTATPFMKGNVMEDMLLMGLTGPIATSVTNFELIESGILARPFFKFFEVNGPDLKRFSKWADIYERGIVHNAERNAIITTQAGELAKMGKKTLLIVTHKQHGYNLVDMAKASGVKARYIDGDTAYVDRESSLRWLEDQGDCLVVTNIFDEGVDCNAINSIILAAGTKSAPTLFQRTGRAVRRKEKDNYAIVIDFIDKQHPQLLEHSIQRYNLIKAEKGFTII